MESYSDTQTFTLPFWANAATLIVQANSGSLVLEVLLDTEQDIWVTYQTFTADGVYKVDANGATVRLTPADGAIYGWVGL